MTVRIKVVDRGAKRAQRLLQQPRKKLRIGVLEREAVIPHTHDPDVTMGQLAVWHEYGTPDTPARSWLNDWVDEHIDVITRQLSADTLRVLFGKPPEDEAEALKKRGSAYRQQIRGRIRRGIAPQNKAATLRKKKDRSTTPLIDWGEFIDAIRYEVV